MMSDRKREARAVCGAEWCNGPLVSLKKSFYLILISVKKLLLDTLDAFVSVKRIFCGLRVYFSLN